MLRRRLLLAALTVPTIGLPARAQTRAAANGPSSEDVRALLAERTGHGADSLGYVTGIIDAGGHHLASSQSGQSGAADGRALDGDSVFRRSVSVTKVFTALLLADMESSAARWRWTIPWRNILHRRRAALVRTRTSRSPCSNSRRTPQACRRIPQISTKRDGPR